MPPLVSVLPAPFPAEPSPRGVKRSRTPDHSENGHTQGDQDDGTCTMDEECVVMLSAKAFVSASRRFVPILLHDLSGRICLCSFVVRPN
jgi:hypothetical protein